MCRIFGISYGPGGPDSETWSPEELMQIMFPAAVYQGPHAWGWMANIDGEVWYNNHEGRADTPEAMAEMVLPEGRVHWLVGHTRWATHGDPSNHHNNHPILHGNILGVHNGVLSNHREILADTGRAHDDAEVDSEAIFAAVNKWGHRQGLARVEGDMVAVYTQLDKPYTLHCARSFGRDLYFARAAGGSILFASDPRIIRPTEMATSDYSKLKSHRLVRLKEGRVLERIDVPHISRREDAHSIQVVRTGQHFRRPHYAVDSLGRPVDHISGITDRVEAERAKAQAKLEAARGAITSTEHTDEFNRRHNQNGLPQGGYSSNRRFAGSTYLQDHDRWGDKIMYHGQLLSEQDYYQAMLDDQEFNEAAAALDRETVEAMDRIEAEEKK